MTLKMLIISFFTQSLFSTIQFQKIFFLKILLKNDSLTKMPKSYFCDVKNCLNKRTIKYQFRRPFLVKAFFSSVNFWTTLLLKSRLIIDKLISIDRILFFFPPSMLILSQISWLLAALKWSFYLEKTFWSGLSQFGLIELQKDITWNDN